MANQEVEMLAYCKAKGIVFEAYAVMRGCAFDNPQLRQIAEAHRVAVSQVCLRWVLQKGAVMAVGIGKNTSNMPGYAKEDLGVYDFELSDDEMAGLLQGFGWNGYELITGHYTGNLRGVPRLGLPSIRMQDAGQGFRTMPSEIVGQVTSWPCALSAAATWDRRLVRQYAHAIGTEFRAKGANVILGTLPVTGIGCASIRPSLLTCRI